MSGAAAGHVLAVDQGTTSTRAVVVDHGGRIVSVGQKEHRQILPRAGWVEHDPVEIWSSTREVIGLALGRANLTGKDLAAIGITNQRETTVVWDRHTGEPVHPAIVWQDTRTAGLVAELAGSDEPGAADRFKEICGLPLATYFAGPKVAWILRHVPGARERAEAGDLLFGTMDSWLVWNLTGGPDGGVHVTDVTNASRTMLMDLRTLTWSEEVADAMRVPLPMLPQIRTSSEVYGTSDKLGVPIAGLLGDQHAAMVGQACFEPGMSKNTYGTGNFLLVNTGPQIVPSEHGLLSTVCYQFEGQDPVYALEGSIAVTGSLVQWLRDNVGLIAESAQIEELAAEVEDNGGCYVVPAFSGLFAPYWRDDARGAIVGLTRYVTRHHLARAALEATAYQTREVVEAMDADAATPVTELRVDGGMVGNELLMQFQADILGLDVVRPAVTETTALGAAYAAGIAVGFWEGTQDVASRWREDHRWSPQMPAEHRERLFRTWKKAVTRTFDWVDKDTEQLGPRGGQG
ncbi:glycerol kinase GlpK [Ornithinimicrobium kibberense]|uniref:Glycerol kinase n=1 Tax=Ornithinimicrobium kibberense TaxID=282060 RepID=A0ABV5UYT6_9MICO|nr:glycerol kinase GlpK [Ornithinimicrobium kibberense]